MNKEKKYKWKKWLSIGVWTMLGIATVVLLVSAIERKSHRLCKGIEVTIEGVSSIYFVDENDTKAIIQKKYPSIGTTTVERINLRELEELLRRNIWISGAELFFDNDDKLQVKIWEREPIARLITSSGHSFYIDSSRKFIPLSDKFSPRVPVFTHFPTENLMTKADTLLTEGIKNISEFILKDEFWMAQVSQIDITPAGTFEIIPTVGNHLIVFGDGSDYREKFNRLLVFYKQVLAKTGMNRYAVVNVSYDQQIVAVRKDKAARIADSTKAISLMKNLAEQVSKMMQEDSINIIKEAKIELPDSDIEKDTDSARPVTISTNENQPVQSVSLPPKAVPVKTVPVKTNPTPLKTNNDNKPKPATVPKATMPKPVKSQ